MLNLRPGLSGNPFLLLEKLWQKDWERKTEIVAKKKSQKIPGFRLFMLKF